jgi:ribosome-binding factor A
MQDPRLACLTSIVKVNVSSDLRHAKVFVSVMGPQEDKKEVMQGLESAAAYMRRELGETVALRVVPQLRFVLDDSIEEGNKVLHLMDDLASGRREEAHGE